MQIFLHHYAGHQIYLYWKLVPLVCNVVMFYLFDSFFCFFYFTIGIILV